MVNCINSKHKRGVCTKELIKPMFLVIKSKIVLSQTPSGWEGGRLVQLVGQGRRAPPGKAGGSVPAFVLAAHGWALAGVRAWALAQ